MQEVPTAQGCSRPGPRRLLLLLLLRLLLLLLLLRLLRLLLSTLTSSWTHAYRYPLSGSATASTTAGPDLR